jgi:hypothetical protein
MEGRKERPEPFIIELRMIHSTTSKLSLEEPQNKK